MAKEFHGKYDILSVVEKMDQGGERITINASKTMPPNLDFLGYKESQSNGELSRSIKMLILFCGLFEYNNNLVFLVGFCICLISKSRTIN